MNVLLGGICIFFLRFVYLIMCHVQCFVTIKVLLLRRKAIRGNVALWSVSLRIIKAKKEWNILEDQGQFRGSI
jgi:hypothetical protein